MAEIIKFAGQPARLKTAADRPPFKNLEVWKNIEPTFTTAPAYDDSTHMTTSEFNYVDGQWLQQWTVTALSDEQMLQRYYSKLKWAAFRDSLINFTENSAYSQLQSWANGAANNPFNTSLSNLAFALGERSEPLVRSAIADLKKKTEILTAPKFTEAQIAEIDNCLVILGANWSWASL